MATLADSFLADLDDLSGDEEAPAEEQEGEEGEGEDDGDDNMIQDVEELNYDDLNSVAKLQRSQKYIDIMQRVEAALASEDEAAATNDGNNDTGQPSTADTSTSQGAEAHAGAAAGAAAAAAPAGDAAATAGGAKTKQEGAESGAQQQQQQQQQMLTADDPDYVLIVDCNAMLVEVDNEIAIVHNFIRDNYRLKFPELESLVLHPIDYARVVQRIGNETDLTLVDLEGLLPSATIMVVSVTASTTTGRPLEEESLERVMEACERALALDDAKKKMLRFVESRMAWIAPNLSAVVGSAIAAKLMGTAGGLMALAGTPACNVQVLGAKRKNLAGYSTATSLPHTGFVFFSEAVQSTPPPLRMKACRLVAAKCTLAARVDAIRGDPTGQKGRDLLQEIRRKIDKWQEPPPAKQPKPLPVPDAEQRKKRGGRRLRKMKERYAMTDMRKLQNRMQFGVAEESSLGDGIGEGYGMLGQAGSGKLRMSAAVSKLGQKVAKKFKEKSYGSSGNTSGLSSSLAFTPVQGFELSNPQANVPQLGTGTQSTYFSETGSFSRISKKG